MTNLEKFKEIFGDTGAYVKASATWLAKEYVGPVKKTEMDKFITWLDESPLVKYEQSKECVYVRDMKGNPIVRVSEFDKKPGLAYVRYEGLCGEMSITKIKELIARDVEKSDPLKNLFGADSLYQDIFGPRR